MARKRRRGRPRAKRFRDRRAFGAGFCIGKATQRRDDNMMSHGRAKRKQRAMDSRAKTRRKRAKEIDAMAGLRLALRAGLKGLNL